MGGPLRIAIRIHIRAAKRWEFLQTAESMLTKLKENEGLISTRTTKTNIFFASFRNGSQDDFWTNICLPMISVCYMERQKFWVNL